MPTSRRLSSARSLLSVFRIGLLLNSFATTVHGITFDSVPAANLDLSELGHVGLAGDFDGISLYQFEGQNEDGFLTNGSQSLLARYPNGGFATLATADAGIQTMCSFVMHDGTMAGTVIGGNFTSLAGMESQGAVMFNPNTSTITPLPGLSGQVTALLCDQDTNTVYVGGSLKGANSTNAIAWVGTAGWTNLPFAGFNGPVTSITKAANGHIVFGGSFTGLGNATGPDQPDQQVINISGGNITSGSSSTVEGFSDPKNIVCKTSGTDGTGNTWLLENNKAGFWAASFDFGFTPTMLRLWNTHQDGRGTKTWRFTAQPLDGILNLTYIDQTTGQTASCTSECPLSNNSSLPYQDFHFVNSVGMNGFRIDVSAWYGSGGGLDGLELFENDIYAYAINEFNEPSCADLETASEATSTGPWVVTPSGQSLSQYLTSNSEDASVVFMPDIKQSGNYSVNMYTPGCLQSNSCSFRGRVNITGMMASDSKSAGFATEIYQTNSYDKYDQIYFGYIEAGGSTFRPYVTLSPMPGQQIDNFSVVAQRVGFTLISSTGGLNNLFEWDPKQVTVDTAEFANSTFDKAGMDLGTDSGVTALQTVGSTTYVAGNFSTDTLKNIFAINESGPAPLSGGGLDGQVMTMFLNGTNLFVGGKFNNTSSGGSPGLRNMAAYDTSKNSWTAIGGGVDGMVTNIVPLILNITSDVPETVITFTGDFQELLAFGKSSSVSVSGFAVWVPSQNNWLQNLDSATMAIDGELTASLVLPGGGTIFAGSLSTSQLSANGVAALSSAGSLSTLPVHIQPSSQAQASLTKRDSTSQNATGVFTGLFYNNGGRNVTVLGGHFSASASNGSTINNLVFINGSNSDMVTGVGSQISDDSIFKTLAVETDTLYAGGSITGTANGAIVDGLMSYNMITSAFGTQPPALAGDAVTVNVITTRSGTSDVYVGGDFASAGSLDCPGVCVWTAGVSQWNRPGSGLTGTVNAMTWSSTSSLIVGGALSINGANVSLATYDAKAQTWAAAAGANSIPGPVVALAAANSDASELWVAGTATNGSSFLMKYSGNTWNSVGQIFGDSTSIQGIQVLSLSQSHSSSDLVPADETLMITGALHIPGFGDASSALFNGTALQPFALTSSSSNGGGSLNQLFSQRQNTFAKKGGHIAKGFIVLIALAIALGLIFLIVLAGYFAERIRKKREGYMPAPTSSYDRSMGMSRIPPHELFSSLGHGRSGVEKMSTRI